jgi:hypothetical protein
MGLMESGHGDKRFHSYSCFVVRCTILIKLQLTRNVKDMVAHGGVVVNPLFYKPGGLGFETR